MQTVIFLDKGVGGVMKEVIWHANRGGGGGGGVGGEAGVGGGGGGGG